MDHVVGHAVDHSGVPWTLHSAAALDGPACAEEMYARWTTQHLSVIMAECTAMRVGTYVGMYERRACRSDTDQNGWAPCPCSSRQAPALRRSQGWEGSAEA